MPGPDRPPQRLSCNWNPRGGSCPQDLIKLELHRHFLSSACSHNRAFPKGSRRADPHGPQFQLRGRGRRLVSNPGRRPHPQSSHGKIALLVACIAVFRAVAARSSGAEPWRLAVSRSTLTLLDAAHGDRLHRYSRHELHGNFAQRARRQGPNSFGSWHASCRFKEKINGQASQILRNGC